MKSIKEGRYTYYIFGRKVVCVSSYEGKAVRAVAKCANEDTWNETAGKALAKARVDMKVAEKRQARAIRKISEASEQIAKDQQHLKKMQDYFHDANYELMNATTNLQNLLKNL